MINLLHGDCLELMKTIPDNSVDMVLTDPPYGTTACKWDSVIDFDLMWQQLKRIIKPNGAIVLFGSQPFTSNLIMSNPKMFKYEQIWDKNKGTQPQLANIQPMKSHENILVFGKGKINYYPQKTKGEPYTRDNKQCHTEHSLSKGLKPIKQVNTGFRFPKTVLMYPRDFSAQTRLHPTQKPVALLEYLIKTYTQEGETVLDFTMGSGSTGVACVNTNRKFIGIEMDDKYFAIAKERLGL
ncbi:MAG: Prochlorococcus phage [Pseudomonadota bacterium]|jgi:site-specific DNA-methyltransferase (adenine-specific)